MAGPQRCTKLWTRPDRANPCRLGEHNGYVYEELLGILADERASLERDGHISMDYAPGIR